MDNILHQLLSYTYNWSVFTMFEASQLGKPDFFPSSISLSFHLLEAHVVQETHQASRPMTSHGDCRFLPPWHVAENSGFWSQTISAWAMVEAVQHKIVDEHDNITQSSSIIMLTCKFVYSTYIWHVLYMFYNLLNIYIHTHTHSHPCMTFSYCRPVHCVFGLGMLMYMHYGEPSTLIIDLDVLVHVRIALRCIEQCHKSI